MTLSATNYPWTITNSIKTILTAAENSSGVIFNSVIVIQDEDEIQAREWRNSYPRICIYAHPPEDRINISDAKEGWLMDVDIYILYRHKDKETLISNLLQYEAYVKEALLSTPPTGTAAVSMDGEFRPQIMFDTDVVRENTNNQSEMMTMLTAVVSYEQTDYEKRT